MSEGRYAPQSRWEFWDVAGVVERLCTGHADTWKQWRLMHHSAVAIVKCREKS
jgi:hypothetical protein